MDLDFVIKLNPSPKPWPQTQRPSTSWAQAIDQVPINKFYVGFNISCISLGCVHLLCMCTFAGDNHI